MKTLKTTFLVLVAFALMGACNDGSESGAQPPATGNGNLNGGTPNGGSTGGGTGNGGETGGDENGPLVATFDSIQKHIIQVKCLGCHSEGHRAEDVPLSTFQDLTAPQNELVVPGRPDASKLVKVVKGPRVQMPPTRSGIAPLTDAEVAVIEEWIKNGARD